LLFLFSLGCAAHAATTARIAADPLDTIGPRELYRRGVVLARAGDYIRAEQYISAAVERGFPEHDALPALIRVCIESSRLAAALSYAEPYLEHHPSDWPLRLLVASIRMGLEQDQEARTELERVLEDAPHEPPQAHYFLGVLFRDRLDDIEAARVHFRRYLALDPRGSHRDEARAALTPEERGLPVRVEEPAEQPTSHTQ
jgi:tetratricopeptide (TPR) repeat protein